MSLKKIAFWPVLQVPCPETPTQTVNSTITDGEGREVSLG
jgi:hypothetical protein